ncbi:MAG: hypothetical protein AAB756_01410, partial [Patescibacteria group bacterium]
CTRRRAFAFLSPYVANKNSAVPKTSICFKETTVSLKQILTSVVNPVNLVPTLLPFSKKTAGC